jgi:hypothetical protein
VEMIQIKYYTQDNKICGKMQKECNNLKKNKCYMYFVLLWEI